MRAIRLLIAVLSICASISLADRVQCGGADTDAVEKREFSTAVLANPHYAHLIDHNTLAARYPQKDELVKRTLLAVCKIRNVGTYLRTRILGNGALARATISLLAQTAGGTEDLSTTVNEVFGDKAFVIGTGQVSGCTVLTVVSKRAVYMGHFWENLSISTELKWTRNVMNLVFGATPKQLTYGPAIDPSQFTQADDQPHAYIMSPRALEYDEGENRKTLGTGHPGARGFFEHAARLNVLIARLEEIIPGIIVESYDYEVTADQVYPPAPFRLALFEYDPEADAVGANWRLWQEDQLTQGREVQGFGQPAAGSSS
ncbi:hypothetical protein LTR95_005449 [Oleoguttula sp. CCFEE 5521]